MATRIKVKSYQSQPDMVLNTLAKIMMRVRFMLMTVVIVITEMVISVCI